MSVSRQELMHYLTGQRAMNRLRLSELGDQLPTVTSEESLLRFFELQQVAEQATAAPATRMVHDISHLLKIRHIMQQQHCQ